MSDIVFLRGKRVILRPPDIKDAARMAVWINDPEVRVFISNNFPISAASEEDWIRKANSSKNDVMFTICLLDGTPIGNMGIHHINWIDRTATTGAVIGEKEYWGQGYGTDAKMALLEYAFHTLGLRKICSDVIRSNKRSLRYSLHCGYKVEGILKRHIFRDGKYQDLYKLGLFYEDWAPIWRKWNRIGQI